jgi:hypothetical protein
MPFQHFGNGGSHHPLTWLFVLGVILLVGAVVYVAVRYASRPIPGVAAVALTPPSADLLGVVALRYANGEITREEYLRMSSDLGGVPVSAGEPPALE